MGEKNKYRVESLRRSTHVSSHCLEAVSREWCMSMRTGFPASVPSCGAMGSVVDALALASLTSLMSGAIVRKSTKSHVAPESRSPCAVMSELSVISAEVRTSERSSSTSRRIWRRMAHQIVCECSRSPSTSSA